MSWIAAGTAAVSAGTAIYKIAHGAHQRNKARKLAAQTVRPVMGRTSASIEEEQNARNMANTTRLPGQSYAENQIGAQTARANNAIQQTGGSTGEIINGLSNVNQDALNAANDLAYQGAQLNQRNKEMFNNVLENVSNDQKNIFDYNNNQPYQTKMLRAQAMQDASARNIDNGLNGLQDTASNFGTALQYNKALGSLRKRGTS
jgi:hypothetical protein